MSHFPPPCYLPSAFYYLLSATHLRLLDVTTVSMRLPSSRCLRLPWTPPTRCWRTAQMSSSCKGSCTRAGCKGCPPHPTSPKWEACGCWAAQLAFCLLIPSLSQAATREMDHEDSLIPDHYMRYVVQHRQTKGPASLRALETCPRPPRRLVWFHI